MTRATDTDLKFNQWKAALDRVRREFAANPPTPTGYNEWQKPWGGPKTRGGAFVWTGHSSDQQIMSAVRREFIKAQEHACCEHGKAWRNAGGDIRLAIYVSFYRLCACCSDVLDRDSKKGGSPLCEVCSRDELVLEDRSEAAIEDLLREHGFEEITREDALALMNAKRLVLHNCDQAIGGARRAGEKLWSNDRIAMQWAERSKESDEHDRKRYMERDGKVPSFVEDSAKRHAKLMEAGPAYIMSTSGALRDVARERLGALKADPS